MANKGQGLMSEKTWNEIHSEPTTEYDASFYSKKALKITSKIVLIQFAKKNFFLK